MFADVLIEHKIGNSDKCFTYIIPDNIKEKIRVGSKVKVPFGKILVEGFVLRIHENKENIKYKQIFSVEEEFFINKELLELGKTMSKRTISPLIYCYQAMFPKALKASIKTNINKKTVQYIELNDEVCVNKYLNDKKRPKSQIDIINSLRNNKMILKSSIKSSSLQKLIENNIVKIIEKEVNRKIFINKEDKKEVVLSKEQEEAYNEIIKSKNKNILLYGITGSGKTEIYIKLMHKVLKENKNVLFLVPEISLTPQIISRLTSEFENKIAVLHSKLSEGEKYDEYRKILKGEVQVVLGARSAIFAPLNNIGLIIIDECGSASYKQETTPKYNTIDIALERGKYHNSLLIMGSATPLLEQYARGEKGVFKLVELTKRANNKLPNIEIINMGSELKRRNFILSKRLREQINDRLAKKEQVILLLNRRGFSTYINCSTCGYVHKCPHCDITLIYHKTTQNLRCHYCGYTEKNTSKCSKCGSDNLLNLGMGTEKLEDYIKKEFSNAKVLRIDLDTTSRKGSHEKLIESFKNREYDILIGTQMISKGLNFPYVTLVGIINADNSLNIPDFRSHEKTFELLMQTSGRSGRSDLEGSVVIQTFNPENYVFDSIKKQNYIEFYKKEMEIRKILKYPPYFYIVQIKISSKEFELAKKESIKVKNYLQKNLNEKFIILGPSTSNIFKLKNKYYFSIIIKYKIEDNLFEVLKDLSLVNNNKINIDININPMSTI